EAAQSLRAVADRQAVEIIAAARRDAEILRGEGEAERTLIFADAFNRDHEFYQFYRSMQSYRTALGAAGTTMVLTPESEFFQYFGQDGFTRVTAADSPAVAGVAEGPMTPVESGTPAGSLGPAANDNDAGSV